LAGLLATFLGTLNALFLSKIITLFQGQTVFQFLETLGSKVMAGIVGLVIILFAVLVASSMLRDFAELMVISFYPETPMIVFILIMGVLVLWAAKSGFEVIVRMAQFLLPIVVFGILFSGLLTFRSEGLQNFFPLLEKGVSPVIRGGITQWAFFGDAVVWFLLVPHLNERQRTYKFIPLSVVMAGGLLLIVLFLIVDVLGARMAARLTWPYLSLIRYVSIAESIERIEGAFQIVWVAANFIRIVVFFYASVFGLGMYLKLNNSRPIISPMIIIVISLSLLSFDSYIQLRHFYRPETYAVLMSIIQVLIPLFITVFWLFKTKLARVKPS